MKEKRAFRFSLQFPCKTLEQIQTGELLERMGNKKSRFIVHAVTEYIKMHPELAKPETNIQIQTSLSGLTRDDLRRVFEELLIEKGYISTDNAKLPQTDAANPTDNGIDEMLDNLGVFY